MNVDSLIADCGDYSLGTLWWVENTLWREVLQEARFICEGNHPGLSLLRGSTRFSLEAVPMLFGTSKPPQWEQKEGDYFFSVDGVSRNVKLTYFGKLPLRELRMDEFASYGVGPANLPPTKRIDESTETDWIQELMDDFLSEFEKPRIWANCHKRRLTQAEVDVLVAWMKRQNLWL